MADHKIIPLPEFSQLGMRVGREIQFLSPLFSFDDPPPAESESTKLDLVGGEDFCFNVNCSPFENEIFSSRFSPEKYFCPAEMGQPDAELSTEESELVLSLCADPWGPPTTQTGDWLPPTLIEGGSADPPLRLHWNLQPQIPVPKTPLWRQKFLEWWKQKIRLPTPWLKH